VRITRRTHAESLQASDALLPGVGDPSAVSVALPAGTGGGGFATYLPFEQGTRLHISQGPHGTVSHSDAYNVDAVDLETPSRRRTASRTRAPSPCRHPRRALSSR
jgi:hypothetical protein